MNQAFALLAILGGVLLASRVGSGASASSDQGAVPGSGERGGADGSTSAAAPAGGVGVLATASQVLGRVQQAAGAYRTVQGLLPSPGVPADDTLTISSVVGDPQLPLPDIQMSDLIQAVLDDLASPVPPAIEPGMPIGVDVGAFPPAEAIEGLVSPTVDVGEEAAYALWHVAGEGLAPVVVDVASLALIGGEAIPTLTISSVAGEAILGELLTVADLMPITTAELAASQGLAALSPILSVVAPVLMVAGFAYGFYTSGVWRSSDWEEDIPKARQFFGWALNGDPSGGWGISSHFRGDVDLARRCFWDPTTPIPWDPAAEGQGWVRSAYGNLIIAYRLEKGIAEGLGGAIGEHTSIPWPTAWMPVLDADLEKFIAAEIAPNIPTSAYSGDTGR